MASQGPVRYRDYSSGITASAAGAIDPGSGYDGLDGTVFWGFWRPPQGTMIMLR